MTVYKAIAAVQADLAKAGISKDRTNEQQHYRFRGIDDVYGALSPILSKHGLCFLPRILSRVAEERVTKSGSRLCYVTVEAEFDLVAAEDGSKHTVRTFGEAMDSADKATNKAMSAAYKYAAFQSFCIPCEGEDADQTTHDVAGPKAPTPPRAPQNPDSVPTVPTVCPKCGSGVWDNRKTKTKPTQPDFKCKNKEGCDWVQWPPKPPKQEAPPPPEDPGPGFDPNDDVPW